MSFRFPPIEPSPYPMKNRPGIIALIISTLFLEANLQGEQAESGTELKAWLGVATSDVHPPLRQHLNLDEGFGVLIAHTPTGSPAHEAGLKPGDVLTKLDDQLLTTPEHLSILVRSKKKGDEIEVTYIRRGTEQSVVVALDEKEMPARSYQSGSGLTSYPERGEALKRFQWMNPMPDRDGHRFEGSRPSRIGRLKEKELKSAPPKGRPGKMPVPAEQSVVRINNDQGEVIIEKKGNVGTIEISDAEGNVVHKGPYDTATGINGLPEKARNHLEKMKVDDIEILAPVPAPGPAPAQPEPDPSAGND